MLVLAVLYARAVGYGVMVAASLLLQQLRRPFTRLWVPKRRDAPPKCLQDESLGQHHFITANGLKFHYVEKGDRSKPLMFFVHGFPEFWYSWRYQMAHFSKDYWTVAFDMRGYGDSDKPDGVSSYKRELLIDDVKAMVTALGRKKFTLVAHDWGAVIAWGFIETYPEMVDKYVVMNGPHPSVHRATLQTSARQAKMSWYMVFFMIPWLPELMVRWDDFKLITAALLGSKSKNSSVSSDDVEAFKYTFSKGSLSGPINFYRAAMRSLGVGTTKAVVKDIAWPPGIYIFGEEDRFLDNKAVALHEKLIPNLKTFIVKGANHFVQQDDPEAVNSAMQSFLK